MGLTIADVAKVFNQLVGTTDMGQRVNAWLFGILFGFLALALSGANPMNLGGELLSVLSKTSGIGDVITTLTSALYGQGNTPTLSAVATPINPLPGHNMFSSIPLPTWVFMIGIFVWAGMVLWEVHTMLQGGQSLRERAWEWVIVPVTLLAFIIAPAFGSILDTGLYTPIITHFILGAQQVMGIQNTTIDSATFGNPLWLFVNMFGIGKSNGGINLWGVLGNASVSGAATLGTALVKMFQNVSSSDPMTMIDEILRNLLSTSILIEIVILAEAILFALEGTILVLFFNLYPIFSIAIVTNPFSLSRITQYLKVSFQVLGGISIIMLTNIIMALIDYQVTSSKNVAILFTAGWFLSILNIIILAVAIWVIYQVSITPVIKLAYGLVQEVKVTGNNLIHSFEQRSGHLPSRVKNTFNNEYQGDFKKRALQRAIDIADPDGMAQRHETNTVKPYKIEGYDKDIEIEVPGSDGRPETRTVAQEHKAIRFNNEATTQWVWKLLRNEGNVNKALTDIGDELPPSTIGSNFKLNLLGNEIEFPNEKKLNDILDKVLKQTKVYRYSKGKYIDENGTVVPENIAKRGIIV